MSGRPLVNMMQRLRGAWKFVPAIKRFKPGLSVALLAATALTVAAYAYYTWPVKRSVFVSAATQSVRVSVTRERVWRLGDVRLCMPSNERRRRSSVSVQNKQNSSGCGTGNIRTGSLNVAWPKGSVVEVLSEKNDEISFLLVGAPNEDNALVDGAALDGDEIDLPVQTRITLGEKSLLTHRSLVFQGHVVIGAPVIEGAKGILTKGRYQIREQLPMRKSPTVVKTGELFAGDTVRLLDGELTAVGAEGFITFGGKETNGFEVSAAAISDNDLSVRLIRHGFAPTSIVPVWTDRALNDPWSIALTAILGVLLTFITLVAELAALMKKSND